MSARTVPRSLVATLLALVVSGCAGPADAPVVPERAPDVSGIVAGAQDPAGPVLVEPTDPYYDGMSLLGGDPALVGTDGEPLEPGALRDGDEVDLWVGDACAESFPVQCDVETVRVR